jgi:hypothetical protein
MSNRHERTGVGMGGGGGGGLGGASSGRPPVASPQGTYLLSAGIIWRARNTKRHNLVRTAAWTPVNSA